MAYKFITGSAQASGSFKADGPISASGEIAGKELKIGNQTVITDGKVLQNVTFSPDSLSGAVALNIFSEALFTSPNSSIKASGSISASVNMSASGLLFGQGVVVDPAGSIFFRGTDGNSKIGNQGGNDLIIRADQNILLNNPTSGTAKIAGRHFSSSGDLGSTFGAETLFSAPNSSIKASGSITGSNIVALVDVSGAGEIVGQKVEAATTVSGAGEIAGKELKIGNATVITDGKVLQNVTFSPDSLSGAVALNIFKEALFTSPNSAIKASGSISASVDLSASGKVVGGSLITTNFKVTSAGLPSGSLIGDFIVDGFKASGSVQLGSDGQDNVKISGFPNFETGIQYSNMKPTGTINGAQVGVVGESDFFIHCSGGGMITLELAAAANLHEQSGTVLYIKRAASGAFGPMDHNVKIKAGTGTTIEGGNAHIMLETAGASVMLVASGSQGNTAVDTDWQVY